MKKLFKISFIFIAFALISACTLFDKVQDRSSEKLSELIIKYCASTNEQFRTDFRKRINEKLGGKATIKVDCAVKETAIDKIPISKVLSMNRPETLDLLAQKINKVAVVQNQNFDRMRNS